MYICTVQTYIQYTDHIQTSSVLIAVDGSWAAVKEENDELLAGPSNLKTEARHGRTNQTEVDSQDRRKTFRY